MRARLRTPSVAFTVARAVAAMAARGDGRDGMIEDALDDQLICFHSKLDTGPYTPRRARNLGTMFDAAGVIRIPR